MAIDLLHRRQMACKVVKPNESPQRQSGKVNLLRTFWREVDLLKDISHVRKGIRLLTFAHWIYSPISCTLSVSSLRRRSCMAKFLVLSI